MKMKPDNFKILVVDDEKPLTILLSRILKKDGLVVETALSGTEALEKISGYSPNLVITDLKMDDMSGLELMKKVRSERPDIDFILLTAYATVENAVEAMKEGAQEYLIKPLKSPDELRLAVKKVMERQSLMAVNSMWRRQLADGLPPAEVLFAGMEDVWEEVQKVAKTDATVLLTGESGTGKSLIAKVIHTISGTEGPFVELNCAAIPENLIESELFGHERGAFTGAVKSKRGKFELAQNGTIFLDEIGELPLAAQAKLLRVLQDRVFERVGGTVTLRTSARVVAATNQDLEKLIAKKLFREDLYYRLHVFPINLPPLRERKGALPLITQYLVQSISARIGKKIHVVPDEIIEKLSGYSWPGNIRELHNILERAIILTKGEKLELPSIRSNYSTSPPAKEDAYELKSLKDIEKDAIAKTLEKTKGHRRKAAEILGISIRTLQYKLKQYDLLKD